MIDVKLYLYDRTKENYRGEDLSRYLLLGSDSVDTLNEELDTYRLTLGGYPTREEFQPSTKMVLELWQDNNGSRELYRSFSIMVDSDMVEQPIISNDNYFNHHISYYEASVVAQQRVVDNISVTYKLKDVTLDKNKTADTSLDRINSWKNIKGKDAVSLLKRDDVSIRLVNRKSYFWNFDKSEDSKTWESVTYPNAEGTPTTYKRFIPVDTGKTREINIVVPNLEVRNGTRDTIGMETLGYASVDFFVQETDLITGKVTYAVREQVIEPTDKTWKKDWVFDAFSIKDVADGFIVNDIGIINKVEVLYTKRIADLTGGVANRNYTFNIRPNCTYKAICRLHNYKVAQTFPNRVINCKNDERNASYDINKTIKAWYGVDNGLTSFTSDALPVMTTEFTTYETGLGYESVVRSAPPVSAYELFQKALIATSKFEKEPNKSYLDTTQTFYMNDNDIDKLKQTTIVENFYNQKNLWQMLIEIGKYIHCVPKISFGENDRFLVEWNKLGVAEQSIKEFQPISIFNSKRMEDYVSSCTSYITNAVQLGGIIDEWVAPKSNSEDYLVYNDVAKIFTSKPIIEIVDFGAKYIGKDATITKKEVNLAGNGADNRYPNGFIFAKEIYNILGIDAYKASQESAVYLVTKGFAIYYTLGKNVIEGLTYRLPTVSQGEQGSEYAIKNILGLAFGIDIGKWKDIKVNDFIFHIVYRTKDSLRSEQSRPDLRKYLLNSKYDEFPKHQQFNNQQDIVVDSTKLGNNIYGKLIRTGNSTYTMTEWQTDLNSLKKSGELYDIFGNLYYVSKVKNTYFADHIISDITFSKDFNQLSEIIGIPSEPRFYEISEQSNINREVAFNEFFCVGTKGYPRIIVYTKNFANDDEAYKYFWSQQLKDDLTYEIIEKRKYDVKEGDYFHIEVIDRGSVWNIGATYSKEYQWIINLNPDRKWYKYQKLTALGWEWLKNILLGTASYPKYVITTFKADRDNPNSTYDGESGNADWYTDICSPASTYSLQNTLTIEWDMVDNFSAGDSVVDPKPESQPNSTAGKAYRTLTPIRYKDVFGRVDLVDILVYQDLELTPEQVLSLPNSPIITNKKHQSANIDDNLIIATRDKGEMDNSHGIAVMLDNREVFSGNFNIQMLTDSDRFVLSGYLWQPKSVNDNGTHNLKLALLASEVNKISFETIKSSSIIEEIELGNNVEFWKDEEFMQYTLGFKVNIANMLAGKDLSNIKALAIIDDCVINGQYNTGEKYFVLARNIGGLDDADKKQDWYFSQVNKDFFKKQ